MNNSDSFTVVILLSPVILTATLFLHQKTSSELVSNKDLGYQKTSNITKF